MIYYKVHVQVRFTNILAVSMLNSVISMVYVHDTLLVLQVD